MSVVIESDSTAASSESEAKPVEVDVLIVGAGLSGVGMAWRLQQRRPGTSYLILDARQAVGGTWDLFRYPGIRSDSDIQTFAFPFAPWTAGGTLADGPSIKEYVAATAATAGIDGHIRFGTKVSAASFSTARARWDVTATGPDGRPQRYRCRFLVGCTGYFDHERGHQPDFPGRSDFRGVFVHPQQWPEDLDYTGRRVVVIGSGATAVTLVPAMAETAAHVTMLQRSPTYVASLPDADPMGDRVRRRLPAGVAHRVLRARNIVLSEFSYRYARLFPTSFAGKLRGLLARHLDDDILDEHFTPTYRPWDQRVCRIPDGDLARAIRSGQAQVVTDTIDRLVPEGVRLTSGRVLPADVVVSATGLSLLPFGGIRLDVDGREVDYGQALAYRGLMLEGVPNFAFTVGYTNASWTLRADLVARYVCRLLGHMSGRGYDIAMPTPASPQEHARTRPLLGLSSSYVLRSMDAFPKRGARSPWTYRQSYLVEAPALTVGDVRAGMSFGRSVSSAR